MGSYLNDFDNIFKISSRKMFFHSYGIHLSIRKPRSSMFLLGAEDCDQQAISLIVMLSYLYRNHKNKCAVLKTVAI